MKGEVKEMASRNAKSMKKQAEYAKEYNSKNYEQWLLRISKIYDTDILEKLNSVPNKKDYIYNLIREDIAREKGE